MSCSPQSMVYLTEGVLLLLVGLYTWGLWPFVQCTYLKQWDKYYGGCRPAVALLSFMVQIPSNRWVNKSWVVYRKWSGCHYELDSKQLVNFNTLPPGFAARTTVVRSKELINWFCSQSLANSKFNCVLCVVFCVCVSYSKGIVWSLVCVQFVCSSPSKVPEGICV